MDLFFFSTIASGIVLYGWRQKRPLHFAGGAAIIFACYVVEGAVKLSCICLGILAVWYFLMKRS